MPFRPRYLFQLTEKGREKVRLNQFYMQAEEGHTGICEAVLRCLACEGPLSAREVIGRLGLKYEYLKIYSAIYNNIQLGWVEKVAKHIKPLNNIDTCTHIEGFNSVVTPAPPKGAGM